MAPSDGEAPDARVLIVDDDAELRARLGSFLRRYSIEIDEAADGEQGLAALARSAPDAVLLDIMLPGLDGLEVMKRIRSRSDVPVLLLTARDTETDRVFGLEVGADDYIGKPFRPRELLARLRAVLRRASHKPRRLSAGGIDVDAAARIVRRGSRVLPLSGIEFDLLVALMRAPGTVLPRGQLLREAGRNHATVTERTVDVHLSRLRRKLGDDPRAPRLIKTVHGIGYVFIA